MRLEITRRADLAVRAMRTLGDGRRWKAQELADAVCSTPGYMPQVIQPLVRAGWVRSDPGPTGGYSIVIGLDDVTVLEVIEAVDGPTNDGTCIVAGDACNEAEPCVLHDAWTSAREELMQSLDSIRLSSLTIRVTGVQPPTRSTDRADDT